MNPTNQKIIGNLGLVEIVAMAVGAGVSAYFVLHEDTATALEVGAVALGIGAGIELLAAAVGIAGL